MNGRPLDPAPPLPIEAVVIGASAGGVKALLDLFEGLPPSFALPIVLVLHMPERGQSRLATLLDGRVQIPTREARDKEPVLPGRIYVAPSGVHLSIETDLTLSFSGEAPVHHSRPSIDVLMSSAADAYGAGLMGVLLTGASADGAEGLARIGQQGGFTVVQDPVEAESPAMPLAAIRRRAPDRVLPLAGIGSLLLAWGCRPGGHR